MTLLERRNMLMRGGNSIDWENIARGMCNGITPFSLPAEVWGALTNIPNSVATGRRNLRAVVLPSGITKIGNASFYDCRALSDVTFPNTLEVIDSTAFYYCLALTEVELPSTVTTINSQAFQIINMEKFVIHATTPPTLAANAFKNGYPTKIYVPDSAVNDYKTATNWSALASRIFPISDLNT